ncbi:MAG: retention module-containing protein, partial [Alcaligenes nematophilus]|uniref:retention module-containing protein n=1 Tax=Alcaligenes nematophilus TaxID=2994643 RepID=UPI003CFF436A
MALDTVLVTQVQGTAWIRTSDGSKVTMQEGMRVPVNAEIVTENGASVELQIPGSPPMTISDNREFLVSGDIAETDVDAVAAALANPDDPAITAVLAALESGQDPFAQLDPTAAVLTGGGEGGGSSFTRLVSIVETTRPLALEYPRPGVPSIENVRLGGYSGGDEDPTLVTGTTVITLETPDHITEGDPYEIVARVGQPVTGQDLIISLTNGSTITIPVGSTEGRITVENPYLDDVYRQGDRPETVGITGTTGGNYENLDTSSTTTTTIKDDTDKTTITLESPSDMVEGKEYEIVARVDNPVTGEDLVIQLDNGKTITIPVGGSEGKVMITPRDDDAYKQGDEPVKVGITGTTGGNYEDLDTTSTTTTTVKDDNDKTTITLESPTDVVEGKGYEIVARVDNPVTGEDLVIQLDNGKTITILVGSSEGKVTITPRDDDAYQQGDEPVTVGITGTEGGNYESLDTSSTTTTTVKDDSDKSTITLESPTDVVEGKEYDIVARVDNPVTGEDLVIELDNGKTITIPVGSSEGKVTITPRGDDAYKQGDEPVTVGITGTTGGNYENLDTSSTTTTAVLDDTDEVIATLTATPDSITEEGGAITYTVTLTNKDGLSVKEHGGLTITLADGTVIEIAAGQASGSQVVDVPAKDDNVIGGQDTITNSIDTIAGGEVFEQLTPAGQTSVGVTDEPVDPENPGQPVGDKVTVVLSATEETSEDGGKIVYTAKLVDADGKDVTTNNAITVTLKNGETITIEANASSGTVETPVNRDDVFVETDAITNAITDIDEANAGQTGAFENLTYDGSDVTTAVLDDTDEVIATLTATPDSITEEG